MQIIEGIYLLKFYSKIQPRAYLPISNHNLTLISKLLQENFYILNNFPVIFLLNTQYLNED